MRCRPVARRRRALSILELLGCLFAVAGGVVLGSLYLGVDVREVAVGLAGRTPTTAPPTEPATTNATVPPAPIATSPTAAPAGAHPAAPPPAVAAATPPAPAAVSAEPGLLAPVAAAFERPLVESITPEQRTALTREYWAAINQCIDAEATARRGAVDASGEWELYDYLSRRSAGHQSAADCIARLNLRGVDDHVAAYAEQVQDWHEAGGTLFARAKDLLTDAPTAQLSGPFAQSWQSAATQHQMEERLLKEKHQAVQAYLDHADRDAAASAPQ